MPDIKYLIIGVDPGPTTGIAAMWAAGGTPPEPVRVIQCDALSTLLIVNTLAVRALRGEDCRVLLAVEPFVVNGRAGRSATPQAGAVTRSLITELDNLACMAGVVMHCHTAARVKNWATNTRLAAAGLLTATEGMGHARDAARHALHAATRYCGAPDPLSRRTG